MSTGKTNRFLKLLVAIWLLPAGVAIAVTAGRTGLAVVHSAANGGRALALAFAGGYLLWLAVFVFLPRTTRTYVLGHELTHALWALLMGARVSGLRVGKSGGQVQTSKNNWVITLAPYFFPFYAMLFILGFFIGHWCWGFDEHFWVLFFLVGLGWSFHITFTLYTLFIARQPDVQSQGWLFSMVVIFCMNLLTILLSAAALSRVLSLTDVLQTLGADLLNAYAFTYEQIVTLVRHAQGW